MSGWLKNYRDATSEAIELSEKALGGRVITRTGSTVRAHVARARGIFVDSDGRLRCSQNGEFTDLDRSNCVDDFVFEGSSRIGRLIGNIPERMRSVRKRAFDPDSGYKPSRTVRMDSADASADRSELVDDFVELVDNGLPLDSVPDAILWNVIKESDRFVTYGMHDNDAIDDSDIYSEPSNYVYMVTDSLDDRVYFAKIHDSWGYKLASESNVSEMFANELAHEMGLPAGSVRYANDAKQSDNLVVLIDNVGDHVVGDLIQPVESPWSYQNQYDSAQTFGRAVPHDVDNLASMLVMDWVTYNADRHIGNFFLTRDNDGVVHVVPIDHGFIFHSTVDLDSSPQDFVGWATHDTDLFQSAGWLHALAQQEINGFATREEILDALQLAINRAQAADSERIYSDATERLPDGYLKGATMVDTVVPEGLGHAVQERADSLSAITREELNDAIERIVRGESTMDGRYLGGDLVKYESSSTGIVVARDVDLYGLPETEHRLRQPNGMLVRGVVQPRDAVPEETFRIDYFFDDEVAVAKVNQDGPHAGFNPLHTSEEEAQVDLYDHLLYRELSSLWSEDKRDSAYLRLSAEAEYYGFEYISETMFEDLWDRGSVDQILDLFWGPRQVVTGYKPPFIDTSDKKKFFSARSLPEPSMIRVPREAISDRALVTERDGVFRVYGDLNFSGDSEEWDEYEALKQDVLFSDPFYQQVLGLESFEELENILSEAGVNLDEEIDDVVRAYADGSLDPESAEASLEQIRYEARSKIVDLLARLVERLAEFFDRFGRRTLGRAVRGLTLGLGGSGGGYYVPGGGVPSRRPRDDRDWSRRPRTDGSGGFPRPRTDDSSGGFPRPRPDGRSGWDSFWDRDSRLPDRRDLIPVEEMSDEALINEYWKRQAWSDEADQDDLSRAAELDAEISRRGIDPLSFLRNSEGRRLSVTEVRPYAREQQRAESALENLERLKPADNNPRDMSDDEILDEMRGLPNRVNAINASWPFVKEKVDRFNRLARELGRRGREVATEEDIQAELGQPGKILSRRPRYYQGSLFSTNTYSSWFGGDDDEGDLVVGRDLDVFMSMPDSELEGMRFIAESRFDAIETVSDTANLAEESVDDVRGAAAAWTVEAARQRSREVRQQIVIRNLAARYGSVPREQRPWNKYVGRSIQDIYRDGDLQQFGMDAYSLGHEFEQGTVIIDGVEYRMTVTPVLDSEIVAGSLRLPVGDGFNVSSIRTASGNQIEARLTGTFIRRLYDDDGNLVLGQKAGSYERTIRFNSDSSDPPHVYHSMLYTDSALEFFAPDAEGNFPRAGLSDSPESIKPDLINGVPQSAQRRGLASMLNSNASAHYAAAGYADPHVGPAGEGQYVWPKQGFGRVGGFTPSQRKFLDNVITQGMDIIDDPNLEIDEENLQDTVDAVSYRIRRGWASLMVGGDPERLNRLMEVSFADDPDTLDVILAIETDTGHPNDGDVLRDLLFTSIAASRKFPEEDRVERITRLIDQSGLVFNGKTLSEFVDDIDLDEAENVFGPDIDREAILEYFVDDLLHEVSRGERDSRRDRRPRLANLGLYIDSAFEGDVLQRTRDVVPDLDRVDNEIDQRGMVASLLDRVDAIEEFKSEGLPVVDIDSVVRRAQARDKIRRQSRAVPDNTPEAWAQARTGDIRSLPRVYVNPRDRRNKDEAAKDFLEELEGVRAVAIYEGSQKDYGLFLERDGDSAEITGVVTYDASPDQIAARFNMKTTNVNLMSGFSIGLIQTGKSTAVLLMRDNGDGTTDVTKVEYPSGSVEDDFSAIPAVLKKLGIFGQLEERAKELRDDWRAKGSVGPVYHAITNKGIPEPGKSTFFKIQTEGLKRGKGALPINEGVVGDKIYMSTDQGHLYDNYLGFSQDKDGISRLDALVEVDVDRMIEDGFISMSQLDREPLMFENDALIELLEDLGVEIDPAELAPERYGKINRDSLGVHPGSVVLDIDVIPPKYLSVEGLPISEFTDLPSFGDAAKRSGSTSVDVDAPGSRNWSRDRDYPEYFETIVRGKTYSGYKAHVLSVDNDEVDEVLDLIYDEAVAKGWSIKAGTSNFFATTRLYGRQHRQYGKGVTVYFPDPDTWEDDARELERLLDGYNPRDSRLGANITDDTMLSDKIGLRYEYKADPGSAVDAEDARLINNLYLPAGGRTDWSAEKMREIGAFAEARSVERSLERARDLPEPVRRREDISVPPSLTAISDRFNDQGFSLYLVGGAVRDTLLGEEIKDYDLATDATPDQIQQILEDVPDAKFDLQGEHFAVVRVKMPDGQEYEIATFRRDVGSSDKRRPDSVEFATIEEDVLRRDLTMNAMFYDLASGEIVDYVGGIDDLENNVVRTVGSADDRFSEDRLRVLRALRFSGRTGFDMDTATYEAIKDDPSLSQVSPERVREEFLNGLRTAKDSRYYLALAEDLGLLSEIFPTSPLISDDLADLLDLPRSEPGTRGDPLVFDIDILDVGSERPAQAVLAIASLLRKNKSLTVSETLREAKYTNDEIADISFLHELGGLDGSRSDHADLALGLKKALKNRNLSDDDLRDYARHIGLDMDLVEGFISFARADQAVDSRDIIDQGFKGPDIARRIDEEERRAYVDLGMPDPKSRLSVNVPEDDGSLPNGDIRPGIDGLGALGDDVGLVSKLYVQGLDAPGSDPMLASLYTENGFGESKPKIVSPERFDELIAQGWVPIWRGMNPSRESEENFLEKRKSDPEGREDIDDETLQMGKDFLEGSHWAGIGMYGNGSYFSRVITEAQSYADDRANNGVLIQGLLPPGAVDAMEKFDDLRQRAQQVSRRVESRIAELKFKIDEVERTKPVDQTERRRLEAELRDSARYFKLVAQDVGRYAASLGIPYYYVNGSILVVLDRSAIVVKSELGTVEGRYETPSEIEAKRAAQRAFDDDLGL